MIIFVSVKIKNVIFAAILLFVSVSAYPQKWEAEWKTDVNYVAGTGDFLPFWLRTGHDGIVPLSTSLLVTGGADIRYEGAKGWKFEAGTNLAAALTKPNPVSDRRVNGLVDRLYVSGSWKMLHLDFGMKPRARELDDISVSGGNITYSRNARNIPGINLWSDWIYFEKGHWFGIKGNLAHYQMIDNRYVSGAMLHDKSLAMKFALGRKVDLSFGMEHWAQWGGDSPLYGRQPASFDDYVKVFFAKKGGVGASASDRINVLGNHLGRQFVRVDWRAEDFVMTFQYDKPFEDGSGMKLKNVPDGIWSVQCSFNERDGWLTDVIYEFISTTWQSGPVHDRPATDEETAGQDPSEPTYGRVVLGGCDDYFANGEYMSGWTNYNRVIGCPLLLPSFPGEDGITKGMASNRLRGHHLGVKGVIFNMFPYKFMATYSRNYGRYNQSQASFFSGAPYQLSLALELECGDRVFKGLPFGFAAGVYGDFGELYQDSVGCSLKIFHKGGRRF